MGSIQPLSDQTIIDKLAELGIDYQRLKACMDARDNWGGMVHAFEYLSVCGVVLDAMRRSAN